MHQRDYASDPELLGRVFDLLDVVFPGLAGAEEALHPLGLDWAGVSTPFVAEDEGRIVSHVGMIELDACLNGVRQPLGSIHAVATHPEHRRRGHYRRVFEEVLAWCDGRYETLHLTTANPEYYEPFGFRHVGEHRFVGELRLADAPPARALNLAQPADLALLHQRLDHREPVSQQLGVARERAAFLVAWARKPLAYVESLGALVAYEVDGETLRLVDVVAPSVVPVDDLAAAIAPRARRVEVQFTPDRLEGELRPEPFLLDGDDHLMVRGPYPDGPVMLPRTSRT